MFIIGPVLCQATLASLQQDLITNGQLTKAQYDKMFLAYRLPNIIIPLIGGVAIDKIGVQTVMLVCLSLAILGQAITTIGGFKMSYPWLIAGRLVFASSNEIIPITQAIFVSMWFKNTN